MLILPSLDSKFSSLPITVWQATYQSEQGGSKIYVDGLGIWFNGIFWTLVSITAIVQIKLKKEMQKPQWPRTSRTKLEDSWLPDVNSYQFRLHHQLVIIYKWLAVWNTKIPRKRRCHYDYPIYDSWCYNSAGEEVVSFNKYC